PPDLGELGERPDHALPRRASGQPPGAPQEPGPGGEAPREREVCGDLHRAYPGLRRLTMGPSTLAEQLTKRGYQVERCGDVVVVNDYVVQVGRFAGQTIKLAFETPADYEITPPGGFHTSPHLVAPGNNGVHASPLGADFCYWSRPPHDWGKARN